MPILLKATVICDSCGKVLQAEHEIKQGDIDSLRWKWTNDLKQGVVAVERIRRRTQLFCDVCADRPQ